MSGSSVFYLDHVYSYTLEVSLNVQNLLGLVIWPLEKTKFEIFLEEYCFGSLHKYWNRCF